MAGTIPVVMVSMVAVAGALLVLVGLMGGLRRREMSIVDYPELPKPSDQPKAE